MRTFRAETTVASDGTLTLEGIPFRAGDKVEVIVRARERKGRQYPLRGTPVRFDDPFTGVVEDEWEALK